MLVLMRYSIGVIVEAVVLWKEKNRMRVAVAGYRDALVLRRLRGKWYTETRQPVEFDFLMSPNDTEQTAALAMPVRAAAAVALIQ